MRILHVYHHYKPCIGGIETVIFELCRRLKDNGNQCSVLCLNKYTAGNKKLAAKESFPEAEVERIGFLNLGFYKIAPFGLGRLKEFDIVHMHGLGFFADFLAITKFLHKKPLVLSTHGGIFHTKNMIAVKKIYFKLWNMFLSERFDKIVAVSKQDKELFSKARKKLVLVENGIDFAKFSKIKRVPEKGMILYFGRIAKNKGLFNLVSAFAEFKKNNGIGRLVIAGSGNEEITQKLKEKVKELGIEKNVLFTGKVSNEKLADLLSITGFFASASKYEGFGITVLEAMAAGVIPLLNKIPVFENFSKRSESCVLINFETPEKAAVQIAKSISMNAAEKKVLEGKAKEFASGFDWSKKTKEYEKNYAECVSK